MQHSQERMCREHFLNHTKNWKRCKPCFKECAVVPRAMINDKDNRFGCKTSHRILYKKTVHTHVHAKSALEGQKKCTLVQPWWSCTTLTSSSAHTLGDWAVQTHTAWCAQPAPPSGQAYSMVCISEALDEIWTSVGDDQINYARLYSETLYSCETRTRWLHTGAERQPR